MVKTRRPLGSLCGEMNVGGEETLRNRVRPKQTPVQRHTRRMYEMREEAWRGLTRQRVAAFLRLFFFVFRRDGERSASASCDLPPVKERACAESRPVDLQVVGVYHGGEVLADHAGRF